MQGEYQAPVGPPPGKGPANGANYQQQPNYAQNYQQQPPNYGQNYGPGPNETQYGYQGQGDKPAFTDAFKLDKPKFNDLWAGILVCHTYRVLENTHVPMANTSISSSWFSLGSSQSLLFPWRDTLPSRTSTGYTLQLLVYVGAFEQTSNVFKLGRDIWKYQRVWAQHKYHHPVCFRFGSCFGPELALYHGGAFIHQTIHLDYRNPSHPLRYVHILEIVSPEGAWLQNSRVLS